MINARLTLTISNYITGEPDLVIPNDIGLTPFYANPEEILLIYSDEGSEDWIKNFEKIVNIVFNGSKDFDRFLRINRFEVSDPSVRAAMAEKYVLCYATYWSGIKIFKDSIKSVSKTKNLGDFQVSYRGDQNTTPVDSIIKDARDCLVDLKAEIKKYISVLYGEAKGFGFRKYKAKVNVASTRRWDYMNPEMGIAFAGNKRILQDGSSYKTGAYYQYWMVGKLGYDNWGYDGNYSW